MTESPVKSLMTCPGFYIKLVTSRRITKNIEMKTANLLCMSAIILAATSCGGSKETPTEAEATDSLFIQRSDIRIADKRLTPEALWAMGRIGSVAVSPDAAKVAYTVSYYSVPQNKSNTEIFLMNADGSANVQLTRDEWQENQPAWIKDGKSWFANPDLDAGYWWDSGNIGANIIGEANPTSPEESFLAVSGDGKMAARLETVKVVIAMAGGNVFSGHFGSVQGLGAEVFFGRPFETRPLRMTGWYSYEPVPIDNVNPPSGVDLPFDRNTIGGRMDRCHIFVYVTAWDGPCRVNTNEHVYLDVNDPDVIGYGELVDSTGTGGQYKQFSIDIKYRDHRKPTYCAVVAVASKYADFFTGGIGSLMYVDEFAFEYDGEPVWEEPES